MLCWFRGAVQVKIWWDSLQGTTLTLLNRAIRYKVTRRQFIHCGSKASFTIKALYCSIFEVNRRSQKDEVGFRIRAKDLMTGGDHSCGRWSTL